MIFRPATPGFLVTLTATVLLAVVSFNVPFLKSIFFLKASLAVENVDGTITLGTLGYCIEISGNQTCTKPSVGYEFDPNKLLGDNISFAQIPEVVVKWITYALFLHVIALCAAAVSALFGLLAHVREMAMTCFSSCISGFAAVITLIAFIFDIVLFFLAKSRINAVKGGSAQMGTAVWLTLAAWVLLFFSGCFYACGRCCISRRPRGMGGDDDPRLDNSWMGRFRNNNTNGGYPDQMRLDAVKAEADRKARQAKGEIGLPAFPEYDPSRPLNTSNSSKPQYLEDESDEDGAAPSPLPYRDNAAANVVPGAYPRRTGSAGTVQQQNAYRGGYAQAPHGTRAVDEYYSPTRAEYPPSMHSRSNYSQSTYSAGQGPGSRIASPPAPTPAPQNNQYLAVGAQGGHSQYPSGREYGHTNNGTTYHTAASHASQHWQDPSSTAAGGAYGQYDDPYAAHPQPQAFSPDTYNNTAALAIAAGVASAPNPYDRRTPPASHSVSPPLPGQQRQPSMPVADHNAAGYYSPPSHTPAPGDYDYYTGYGGGHVVPDPNVDQHGRSYTLGGGGYGGNSVPDNSAAYGGMGAADPYADPYAAAGPSRAYTASPPQMPSPVNTSSNVAGMAGRPAGPRSAGGAGYASDVKYGYAPSQAPAQPQAQAPMPQPHGQGSHESYEDSPPGYDAGFGAGPAQPPGGWDSKQPR